MSTKNTINTPLRYDLRIVASWINPGAKVLGLGCGEGDLLFYLKNEKQVSCTGIEHNETRVAHCIERGLTVVQGDINQEVVDYPDNTFDYVICTLTLQQIYESAALMRAMLRIGKRGIVSFPNFSHWRIRLQLLTKGYAPKTKQLPYEWHNTPNIRVITLKDFRKFAKDVGFTIYKEVAINTDNEDRVDNGKIVRFLPDWLATYGIFLIGREPGYSPVR